MNILSHIRALRYLGNTPAPTRGVEQSEGPNGTVWRLQFGANDGAKPVFGHHPGNTIVEHGVAPTTNGVLRP